MNTENKTASKARQLASIRKALSEVEELRAQAKLPPHRLALEKASIELRDSERAIIKAMGEELAASIKAQGESLEELAAGIRKRIEKMGRVPKRLDSLSKTIIKIVDIIKEL